MNLWAVLLAAASSFMLGGLWYSPALFGRIWNTESGAQEQAGHAAKSKSTTLSRRFGAEWARNPAQVRRRS